MEMKNITLKEQKRLLVEMLDYVTKICLDNNIKFSLIGGSLIGAIRHGGIIPWDDDIDIALMPEDYQKLMCALSRKKGRYKLMQPCESPGYYYPFAKLIDTRTIVNEKNSLPITDYGVYIDIFRYRFISNIGFIRFISYKRQALLKRLLGISVLSRQLVLSEKNIFRKIFYRLVELFPMNFYLKRYMSVINSKETNYVVIVWPAYGYRKDIFLADWFKKYTIVSFEKIQTMITESYDDVLRITFGDYMKLPPDNERVTHHHMEMYWKE